MMKTQHSFQIAIAVMALVFTGCSTTDSSQKDGQGKGNAESKAESALSEEKLIQFLDTSTASANLTPEEKTSLVNVREEEKLARDVYGFLYDQWDKNLFTNISASEQSHTNAVEALLDKYEISDPVSNEERGVFQNEEFSKLYTELSQKGSESLISALQMGAKIEELDIHDIEEDLAEISNSDIQVIYESLLKGSRNHLRSFYKQIQNEGADYTPVFISQEQFEEIITSEMETDPS